MKYIQRATRYEIETVDQFETLKEARTMVMEYRMADLSAVYYISSRSTKEWRLASQINTGA
jgi:hypothetical protein